MGIVDRIGKALTPGAELPDFSILTLMACSDREFGEPFNLRNPSKFADFEAMFRTTFTTDYVGGPAESSATRYAMFDTEGSAAEYLDD